MRCLLPLLLTVPLAAIDLFDVCDLRLSGGAVGGDVDLDRSGTQAMEGRQLGVDAVLGVDLLLVGVVGGAGVTADRRSGGGWERTTTVGRVFAGPYLGVGPVNLELTGSVGRGRERLEAPGGADDRAGLARLGADALVTVELLHLVVGAGAGVARDAADHDWNGGRDRVRADSWHVVGLAGWRF